MSDMSTPFGHFVDKPDGLGIGDGSATMTNMGHMGGQHQRLESVDAGLAKLAEMRECVDAIAQDGAKFFDKGNKAAGVRARKALQDLKSLAQELRVAIQRCKTETAQLRLMEQGQ